MPKLNEIVLTPPKILVYGKAGTGKTVWALTAGRFAQILDLDLGVRSGLEVKDRFSEDRRKVEVLQIFEKDPRKAMAYLDAKMKILAVSDQCLAKTYPFKVLIVDSLSSLGEYALRYIMANSGGIEKQRAIQHWGMAISEIENFLMVLRSLPIAVILIAHDQRDKVDGSDVIELGIYGKNLPGNILKYFDEIFYSTTTLEAGNKQSFIFRTKSDAVRTARSRTNFPDPMSQGIGVVELLEKMGWKLEETVVPPKV